MSIAGVHSTPTPPHISDYTTSPTAPYQSSPTNSNASNLPLTQVLPGGTDHTFTSSTVDHELNAVTTPTPSGAQPGQAYGNGPLPDSLAQSGIGLHVSSTQ